MNHAHLFNLVLNSCVQGRNMKISLESILLVSLTIVHPCSGPSDTPVACKHFVPGVYCCIGLDSHAHSRSTLNAFSV